MRWKSLDYKSSKHYVEERAAQEEQADSSDDDQSSVSDDNGNLLLSQQEGVSSLSAVSQLSNGYLASQEQSNASYAKEVSEGQSSQSEALSAHLSQSKSVFEIDVEINNASYSVESDVLLAKVKKNIQGAQMIHYQN